jgi:hypothetical protein
MRIGSAHHHPMLVFSKTPSSTANARMASISVTRASAERTGFPSFRPVSRLPYAKVSMATTVADSQMIPPGDGFGRSCFANTYPACADSGGDRRNVPRQEDDGPYVGCLIHWGTFRLSPSGHCEERSRGSMMRALSVLIRHDRQIGPLEATRPYIVPLHRTGLCRVRQY